MKPYPLGIDNPYRICQVYGKNRWAIYSRDTFQKIAEFPTEMQAYSARRAILRFQGYNA